MRLFVSEYLCSGAWPEELSGSLAREGRAMLSAILQDAAQIKQLETVTTWDKRLGPAPSGVGEVHLTSNPGEERQLFEQCVTACDATYLIAPECDGLLAERGRFVESRNKMLVGSDVAAIELCADKLKLAHHLQSVGVSTIETWPLEPERFSNHPLPFPCVMKPRRGAGSQETFLVPSQSLLSQVLRRQPAGSLLRDGVIQPYLPGKPVSVAVILDGAGRCRHVFPPADQILSHDGRFAYLGGRVPSVTAHRSSLQRTAERACRSAPGLRSYVGVDLIVPAAPPHEPVVVEINPRLTTSYLGYRRLTEENLAERLLFTNRNQGPIHWRTDAISFTPAGDT